MQGPYIRKYGVETKIPFVLYEVDGVDLRVDAADGGSDCTIMKDEGEEATCENDFVDEGNGYSITLTATEMTAARIVVYVIDSATKVWLDDAIVIETYGNASAQHAIDLDDSVRAGLTALPSANADAAGGLPISDAGGLDLDTKLANTNEITTVRMGALTDWINGGRLDSILDIIAADTTTDIPGTLTTIAAYLDTEIAAIVNAVITNAAGADIAADIIALKAETAAIVNDTDVIDDGTSGLVKIAQDVAAILVDTGTTLDGNITAIKTVTDLMRACSGTVVVNNPGTDTIFDLTAVIGTLSGNDDAYINMQITIYDVSGGVYETRKVTDYANANGRVTLDLALTFPVQDGVDTFILWNRYSPTAAAGGGATAQQVHEYDVSGITTPGLAGYEIKQGGSHLSQ